MLVAKILLSTKDGDLEWANCLPRTYEYTMCSFFVLAFTYEYTMCSFFVLVSTASK